MFEIINIETGKRLTDELFDSSLDALEFIVDTNKNKRYIDIRLGFQWLEEEK